MTADPFDALRLPAAPVDPDPAFARGLRARLERVVLRGAAPVTWQEEETVTVTDTPSSAAAVALHTLTPYLAVTDARAALGFYVEAFGAVRRGEPIVMPDGRVGHAEVLIGDSVLMLADEFAELDLLAPVARGGPSQSLRLEVADPDAWWTGPSRPAARWSGRSPTRPTAAVAWSSTRPDTAGWCRASRSAGRAPATSATPRSGHRTWWRPSGSSRP
ncbi:hypothetical protein BJF78_22020 [Pseudonocardia sp. CNS-139]|nr:hypothetical protein BJF78_22020 [Pseudonocardia sp. CNS-139]